MNEKTKTTKTETLRVRATPEVKSEINWEVSLGHFANEAELITDGVTLMLDKRANGLFANIARSLPQIRGYVPETRGQYNRLVRAYKSLNAAYGDLRGAVDDVDPVKEKPAPNEFKNVLRDFVLPVIELSLGKYENIHNIPDDERITDRLDFTWYKPENS